jgi:hypothetical protein
MNRRTLLKKGGLAALGFGLGGCATARTARRPATLSQPKLIVNLPRVEASWDRVIRTTVGLRPHFAGMRAFGKADQFTRTEAAPEAPALESFFGLNS